MFSFSLQSGKTKKPPARTGGSGGIAVPRKRDEEAKGTPASANESTDLEFLPDATRIAIEEDIERGFFERALKLVSDLSWGRYRNQVHGPILAAREFTGQYTDLLAWAFAEFIAHVARVAVNVSVRVPWNKAEAAGLRFVERFLKGASYHHPWTGYFLLNQGWIDNVPAVAAYKQLHEVAPWFEVAPEDWERVFFGEVRRGSWRTRAVQEGKRRVELLAQTTSLERVSRRNRKPEETVEVPPWDQLKGQKSISQSRAAALLHYDARTIRNRFKDRRLTKTANARVACDDKLLIELRKQHGAHYR